MQNRDLRTLQAVARTGSFRGAADALNMTLSAVSMQMKALEETLGDALFDRSVRPPALTPLGRGAVAAAEDVLEAEDRLRDLARPGGGLAGDFRLGLVASAGPRLLPRFLGQAPLRLPRATFSFLTGLTESLEVDVASGALDAAVMTATGVPPGGLRHRVLCTDRLMIATPAAGALPDAPFLQFNPSTGIGRLIANAVAAQPALSGRRAVILDSVATIRACLRAGVGPTILPDVDLRDCDAGLTPLDDRRDLVLVTRIGTALDALREEIADLFVAPVPGDEASPGAAPDTCG